MKYLNITMTALLLLAPIACQGSTPSTETPTAPKAQKTELKEKLKLKSAEGMAKVADTTAQKKGPIPAPADVAQAPADAEVTASGLASKVLQAGTGTDKPAAADKVKVHYTGWTTDGKMFDSSVARGEPISFPLNGVIKGWTEGVQLMVEGEKRRFWIPGKLAYGDTPTRPGAPSGQLVFDVELIKIGK